MGKKGTRELSLFVLLFLFVPLILAKSDDAQAMSDMAKSLTNLPSSWKPNSDPCSTDWSGVRCDSSNRVVDINLAREGVSGTLPTSLSTLTSLQSLQLQSNSISGPIPSLTSLTSLQRLNLDENSFTSLPPDFPNGLTSLEYLSIDDNPFAPWTLPASLTPSSSISTLTSFSASNATISGTFPEILATLPSLQYLRLSYNNLSGVLPLSLGGSSIQSLQLNNQQSSSKLTGGIDVIGRMPQLTLVWLQSNGFTGPIPDLANITSLQSFNVRDNQLTGVVPPSLTSLSTLQNVSLTNNMLQGPFPSFSKSVTADVSTGNNYCDTAPGPCDPRVTALLDVAAGFNYPTTFSQSWKGNDPCSSMSWLGVTCDSSGKDITVLNFASQKLTGVISPAIANITTLTKLMLSDNNLTGTIPDSLTTCPSLILLDVSNNGLTGDVPKFPSTITLKVSGNRFGQSPSGPDSSGSSSDGSSDGPSGSTPSGGGGSSTAIKIASSIIGIVLILGLIIAGLVWHKKRANAKKFGPVRTDMNMAKLSVTNGTSSGTNGYNKGGGGMSELYTQGSTSSPNQGMHMSIESLRKATNNFDPSSILGQGGFGIVYKGDLNGTQIAVKRSQNDPMGQNKKGQQEFKAEIDVLTKVRHRNLVALLGYCESGSERLLVYEFMSGGTLGDRLFDLAESGARPLTWMQRVVIALDVARGIEYLHSLAQETFIHRDLKPSNILLDDQIRAKVSDFGLVKLASDREKSVMTRLAGTFGYLAPEYAITGKVSTKVDVYAFGVILMEIISGRKVLDDSLPDEESHLVTYFRRNLLDRDRFIKSVDPNLDLTDSTRNALMDMADLARQCTAREPAQRPDMSHCVNRLGPLVDQWKPTSYEDEKDDEDEDADIESGLGVLSDKLQKWKSNGDSSYLGSTFG